VECEWLISKRTRGTGAIRVGVTDADAAFCPEAEVGGLALYLDAETCHLFGTEMAYSSICSFQKLDTLRSDLPVGTRIVVRADTVAKSVRFAIDGGSWIDGRMRLVPARVRPLVWLHGAAGDGVRLLRCTVCESESSS